jgi:hypothetical protein
MVTQISNMPVLSQTRAMRTHKESFRGGPLLLHWPRVPRDRVRRTKELWTVLDAKESQNLPRKQPHHSLVVVEEPLLDHNFKGHVLHLQDVGHKMTVLQVDSPSRLTFKAAIEKVMYHNRVSVNTSKRECLH